VPRIPEIKSSLGLSDGEFGLVLVSSSVGAIIGAQLSGRLIQKLGSRALLRMAQLSMPLGVTMTGLAPNVWVLTIGLFFVGLGRAGMDITANCQAVVFEKLIGKKFLAFLQGAWSIGAFISALVGGSLTNVLTPQLNLILLALVSVVVYAPLTERFLGLCSQGCFVVGVCLWVSRSTSCRGHCH